MKKKYVRLITLGLATTVLIILAVNFAINFWLKNNLPAYIKNNSAYQVSYKTLAVDLFTGDILAIGISISTKNPNDQNTIGLRGTLDTLLVSRLGIYEAIKNKRVNSNQLLLVKPDLDITLAKPRDEKTGEKRNPVLFKNLQIKNGNIAVFRHTKQKFVSVKKLNLAVENIRMTEESVEDKLPMVFDKYDISGESFFFRPDNVYAFTAKLISTKAGQMTIKNFEVVPLLSYSNFLKYQPAKRSMYAFKTAEMNFKDLAVSDNRIELAHAHFTKPDLKIMTTNAKKAAKKKDFNLEIEMSNVQFKDAKVSVLKPDGSPQLSAGNLQLNIERFLMDKETSKYSVPFQYADFGIAGRQLFLATGTQNIGIDALNLNPKAADFQNIRLKPATTAAQTVADLSIPRVQVKINALEFVKNKLNLNLQRVFIDGAKGQIRAANNAVKKKPDLNSISFPVKINDIELKNSSLTYTKASSPMHFGTLGARIRNLEITKNEKGGLKYNFANYNVVTRNFSYRTKFYAMSAISINLKKSAAQIAGFAMKPLVSRAQFIRMIPSEKDLYDIKVSQISLAGKWDLSADNQLIDATQLTLNGVNANIFRSKIPKDDLSEKPLYSKLLRTIKFPLYIASTEVKNATLVYEEDTKKSDGPGKLTFNNLNLTAKNLNSGKFKGKPTQVPITIQCRFMNASPMNVRWNLDTANQRDGFTIAGNVADLPASRINPFIEPYLKIQATGQISDLAFNFKGDYSGIGGTLNLKHQDLKIAVLKNDGEKNVVLSAVANLFVKTDSGKFPSSVQVEGVERDKTKSFFNLFWKGIEQGLKKTLIGANAEKTEQAVKNTVENTKNALEKNKEDLENRKEAVTEKVQNTKEKVSEKTRGLKNLLKKKSD